MAVETDSLNNVANGNVTLVQALARMAVDARENGVPKEVSESVRQRVLDTLGICVAASSLSSSQAVRRFVVGQGGPAQADAVGSAGQMPATWAALMNGTLAHSLDYDDTHLVSVLHPSATIIPACLAAGQLTRATGRRFIAAVAAGLEICVRLGLAGYDEAERNSRYFHRGQHATSICGAVAAAGSVAALLDCNAEGVANAMSVVSSMASGLLEANRTGGTVKRLHCGWSAHAAISAAGLVQQGITGAPTILEGRFGFFQAFLDGEFSPDAITHGLGESWLVPEINFKPYPANHFCHAGIDAALALRRRGLRPSDVASLTLGVPAPALRTVGEPIEAKRRPTTGYEGQFSGPYTVAAALFGGHGLGLGLDDFTDELVRDPQRRALMAKINVVEDPEATEVFPREYAAVITAVTTAGDVLVERVMTNLGSSGRPLSEHDIEVKFSDNVSRAIDQHDMEAVRDAVWSLEEAPTVDACIKPLASEF